METVRLALKSLKYDTKKTKSYFLFQIFLSIAICLCCHFCADFGTYIQNIPGYEYSVFIINHVYFISQTFPPTTMFSIFLLFALVMLGFYAFQFIYQEQSKKIAVFRIGGVNTRKIVLFLFMYLLPITLTAMIVGTLLGFIFVQLLNYLIFSFSEAIYPGIQFSTDGIAITIMILFIQMIYYIILTYGFVYRNEIKDVLNYNNNGNSLSNVRILQENKPFRIIFTLIGLTFIMYLLIKAGNILSANIILGCTAIGIIMKTLIKDIIIPIITKIKRTKYYQKTNGYFGYSFTISNLVRSYGLIFVLSILYQFGVCLIVFFKDDAVDLSISVVLFLIATLAVVISIGFQLLTAAKRKKKEYFELFRIGKTNRDIKSIIKYDLSLFLIIVFLVSNIFPLITFGRSLFDGTITLGLMMVIIGIYSIELLVLYFIVKKNYYRIVKIDN
ncbi:FtsX-like permease family protein [Beduini massiliensis]|uniref:FtsX-like permease family protein n=1 Tax=Beduini massiliensis TaxID=1585974 RepID=UPI00059A8079|nr:FtsX-like permease family protein [Beduini massiliensis]